MSLSKTLQDPISLGSIATLAASKLQVNCSFNSTTGNFEINQMTVTVREGELSGSGPYTWTDRRTGAVVVPVDDIPTDVKTVLLGAMDDAIDVYATEKGYTLVVEKEGSDTLGISVSESSDDIQAGAYGSDTLGISVSEASTSLLTVDVSDTLGVSVTESSEVQANIDASGDTLGISVTESSDKQVV